ncbi:LemA family protein [Eikenella sp. Marseille-P7795]|uniref:LemA family protein n=1 Tax=Eikenella sp. Marseille-P7795 TaxID=2866577 RepID=UPI001CE43360|nr:LemA family protein [Eikenella sp. Marseille-P7795]
MLWIIILLPAALIVVGVMVYNRLVIAQNQYRNAFSQIGVQLQRRHDLIPNLVETTKGYLKHESDTFTQVTQARSQAAGALGSARPENAEAVRQLSAAEAQLTQAIRSLMVQIEAYPELQASANMQQLAEEITSTENRIAFSRQAYNDAAMHYNTLRQLFPHSLIAANFGHRQPAQLLEFPDRAKHQAPPAVRF